ncbi:hypothetical protein Nepgr_005707 [Nepenthes gracilis]|uniref:B box-type domain-containing protein n=1 Tax=Nepenthes gracilis TaxID=150966 RepID=A0AAD3XGQ2_NEPGR|nr:hypothetical protein Nepgr_005707 [Nepenthes gracilis]
MAKDKTCELCNGAASIYCASDSAFLCWRCDAKVHGANFLVARHIRSSICYRCGGLVDNRFSGAFFSPVQSICRCCSLENPDDYRDAEDLDSLSSSSDSACLSTTESCTTEPKKAGSDRRNTNRSGNSGIKFPSQATAKCDGEVSSNENREKQGRQLAARGRTGRSQLPWSVDAKVEGVLVNWGRRLGLDGNFISDVLRSSFGRIPILPSRVTLAALFWLCLRLCGDRSVPTCPNLNRVEEITGVPAKLILAAESKLAPILKRKKQARDQEEGWAECSI